MLSGKRGTIDMARRKIILLFNAFKVYPKPYLKYIQAEKIIFKSNYSILTPKSRTTWWWPDNSVRMFITI